MSDNWERYIKGYAVMIIWLWMFPPEYLTSIHNKFHSRKSNEYNLNTRLTKHETGILFYSGLVWSVAISAI